MFKIEIEELYRRFEEIEDLMWRSKIELLIYFMVFDDIVCKLLEEFLYLRVDFSNEVCIVY